MSSVYSGNFSQIAGSYADQTHITTKTTVAAISIGHTGIGQTDALISLSP